MTKPSLVVVGLLAALTALQASTPQPPREDWRKANAATTRLEPAAFSQLPAAVRADLAKRRCAVPQPSGSRERANVISGSFLEIGKTDWAVLCSRELVSTILVYAGGTADKVHELGSADDASYLQVVDGDGQIGFSRQLSSANPATVSRYLRRSEESVAGPVRYGIEDSFVGKASSVWYWTGRRWLRLAAAD